MEENRATGMVGKCEVCGKEDVTLIRKFFHYDIKCECHSPSHFEIVDHCEDCEPAEPLHTKVIMSTKRLKGMIMVPRP